MTTPLLDIGSYVQPLGPAVSLVPFGPLVSVSVTVAQNDPNGVVVPRVQYSEYMVYVPSTRLVPRLMEAGTLSYHSLHTAYVPLTVLEKQYSTWQFPPQVVGL